MHLIRTQKLVHTWTAALIPRLKLDRARSYQVIRTAHLERARDFAPASILYAARRYDFDPTLATQLDLHRCGVGGLFAILLVNPLAVLEINEPLQLSGLPRAAVAIAAVRIADRLHSRRTWIGAYAIENLDPFSLSSNRFRSRLRRHGEALLSKAVSTGLDRIAYGTDGARRVYRERLGDSLIRTDSRVISAVPAPCNCPDLPTDPGLVLFLGALHERKGILQLLNAWPQILAKRPDARLVVVGKGDLEGEVRARAAVVGAITVEIDPPRVDVHRWLRRAQTLVLFSQPTPRWREQVGLPIVEGLAHGCQIVTSSQTGLARWLADNGHAVLEPDASTDTLANCVVASLEDPRSTESVLADLPTVDGRRAADEWLMSSEGDGHD